MQIELPTACSRVPCLRRQALDRGVRVKIADGGKVKAVVKSGNLEIEIDAETDPAERYGRQPEIFS